MTIEQIFSSLENIPNEMLDEVVEKAKTIKEQRKEEEISYKVKKLNELLVPVVKLLESLEESDMLGDDAEYLLGNEFVVKDYGCGMFIDLKNQIMGKRKVGMDVNE